MKQVERYLELATNSSSNQDELVARVTKHFATRFELGTAVLLTDAPATTLKNVVKHWNKLTRQAQHHRNAMRSAEELLNATRSISRMQRVKFTNKPPSEEPDATFYILKPDTTELPTHCYTLYSFAEETREELVGLLPEDATVMPFKKFESELLKAKSTLSDRVDIDEKELDTLLRAHEIIIEELENDMAKTNEALDTLLSSNRLQDEFLHKTGVYLKTIELAQPYILGAEQAQRLAVIKSLEKHVRVLNPSYLSDHIVDSSSDDAYLLRDSSGRPILSLQDIREYYAAQYTQDYVHLASAIERQLGYTTTK